MSRARVIKSGEPRSPRRRPSLARVVRARDVELAHEREELLQRTRDEAAQLLEGASQEAAACLQRARSEAEAQAARIVLRAQRLVDEQLACARRDLTRLGVGIAEKILGVALELEPGRVVDVVAQVLNVAGRSTRFVARVHPSDLPYLEARRGRLADVTGSVGLELRADPGVTRGGAILETDRGVVDGRVEVQLAALAAALLDDTEPQDGARGQR